MWQHMFDQLNICTVKLKKVYAKAEPLSESNAGIDA